MLKLPHVTRCHKNLIVLFHFALASQLLLSEKEKGNLKECHMVIWLQGMEFREIGVNCESKVKTQVKVKNLKFKS